VSVHLDEFGRTRILVNGQEVRLRTVTCYELLAYLAGAPRGPGGPRGAARRPVRRPHESARVRRRPGTPGGDGPRWSLQNR
jgi:hypothetical protein